MRSFVRPERRHGDRTTGNLRIFGVEVPLSLEGLDPRFRPDLLAMALAKDHDEDFARIGVDPSKAFNLVPNVINTESVLFDGSNVGSRLVEAMALPQDSHAMCHSKETKEEFAEKLCESLALVTQLP